MSEAFKMIVYIASGLTAIFIATRNLASLFSPVKKFKERIDSLESANKEKDERIKMLRKDLTAYIDTQITLCNSEIMKMKNDIVDVKNALARSDETNKLILSSLVAISNSIIHPNDPNVKDAIIETQDAITQYLIKR